MDGEGSGARVRAAQYLRMSTEMQDQSIALQAAAIARYARRRRFEVVRTYEDVGRSGVTIARRPALQRLVGDVTGGEADFDAILVFDISRWGRFQDIDESGHYEFLCRQMGINVHYVAEPFANDGSGLSALFKSIKRVMAADFSRDLSAKVRAAQVRLFQRGYRVAGAAPYGLARQVVGARGNPKATLGDGELKHVKNDRITLVPGPAGEVANVRRIFDLFARDGQGIKNIAKALNGDGERMRSGALWHPMTVRKILRDEVYVGTNVYGRRSRGLLDSRSRVAPEACMRIRNAFEPIVDAGLFAFAQSLHQHRVAPRDLPSAELLARLGALVEAYLKLNPERRRIDPAVFHSPTYKARFGSLRRALERVEAPLEAPPPRRRRPNGSKPLRWRLLDALIADLRSRGVEVRRDEHMRHLVVGDGVRVTLVIIRDKYQRWTRPPWLEGGLKGDATLILRLFAWADEPQDHYLVKDAPLSFDALPPPNVEWMAQLERFRLPDRAAFYDWCALVAAPAPGGA